MVCTAGLVVHQQGSILIVTTFSLSARRMRAVRTMSKNFLILLISILSRTHRLTDLEGDSSAGVPPVPIPNTDVKPCSADGTATRGRVGHRLHFFLLNLLLIQVRGFFICINLKSYSLFVILYAYEKYNICSPVFFVFY